MTLTFMGILSAETSCLKGFFTSHCKGNTYALYYNTSEDLY